MRAFLATSLVTILVFGSSCTQLPANPAPSSADIEATIAAAVEATVASMTTNNAEVAAPPEAVIGTPVVQPIDEATALPVEEATTAEPTEVGIGPIVTGTVLQITPVEPTAVVTGTTQPPATTVPTPTLPITATIVPITATVTVTATLMPNNTEPITDTSPPAQSVTPTATAPVTATLTPTVTEVPTVTTIPTTTVEPTTTVVPTTTVEPTTTVVPTTTVEPTTTVVPTTTVEPTTPEPTPGTPEPTAPPTATASPTSTPTLTPTPGPSPTPTSMPSTVFLGSHHSYSQGSSLFVVGEAINGSQSTVFNVTVIATFHDAGGAVVGATEIPAYLPQTLPTQRNPFRLQLLNAPSSVQSYQLSLRWDDISVAEFDRATIIKEEVNQEQGLSITGEVRNDHRSDMRNLVAVATLYDASGQVQDVLPGSVSVSVLPPGGTTTFTIQAQQPITYSSYLVQVEGAIFR